MHTGLRGMVWSMLCVSRMVWLRTATLTWTRASLLWRRRLAAPSGRRWAGGSGGLGMHTACLMTHKIAQRYSCIVTIAKVRCCNGQGAQGGSGLRFADGSFQNSSLGMPKLRHAEGSAFSQALVMFVCVCMCSIPSCDSSPCRCHRPATLPQSHPGELLCSWATAWGQSYGPVHKQLLPPKPSAPRLHCAVCMCACCLAVLHIASASHPCRPAAVTHASAGQGAST